MLKVLNSLSEYEKIYNDFVVNKRIRGVTNFFINKRCFPKYINEGKVRYEVIDNTLFILVDQGEYYRLYYFGMTSDVQDLPATDKDVCCDIYEQQKNDAHTAFLHKILVNNNYICKQEYEQVRLFYGFLHNLSSKYLEKYKKVFDSKLNILNEYEFNDIVTLDNVIGVLQRAEMVMQIVEEIQKQVAELGEDGRLVSMQLEQLIGGVEKEEMLIVKDYSLKEKETSENIIEELSKLQYEELLKEINIAKILGYENFENYEEVNVYTRGYRILNKIPRMPSNIVENLVQSFESLQHIIDASIEDLDKVEGIGEVRARNIKRSLKRMQEQFVFDNIMN